MYKVFFDSWESIARTTTITILAYITLILFLRVSGKRTLSKMNAFDLVVTIAIGSTLATVMLNKDVALADGVLAFFLLVFLQYFITFISVRNQTFNHLVKSTPALLAYRGKLYTGIMKKERITRDEIHAVIREKGFSSIEQVGAIVLETDGSLTVIGQIQEADISALSGLKRPDSARI